MTAAPAGAPAGLASALRDFAGVVGSEHVLTGDALQDHVDPFSFSEAGAHAPSAAVRPASVEEVRAVLAIATERRTPLWTVSRGRNLAYGGAAPRTSGTVVLDLSRMDRVLEVDEETGYAVVEPGVSFLALHEHLQASKQGIWPSASAAPA